MRVEHDGLYAVGGLEGRGAQHPVWYRNLTANPQIELQDGTAKGDYLARESRRGKGATWWERRVAAYPDYADYQTKTDRQIPVFLLGPAEEKWGGRPLPRRPPRSACADLRPAPMNGNLTHGHGASCACPAEARRGRCGASSSSWSAASAARELCGTRGRRGGALGGGPALPASTP